MQFISSDTSVWIDFSIVDRLEYPFRMFDQYTFVMSEESIKEELLSPDGIADRLIQLGLKSVQMTEEEYVLASQLTTEYIQLSPYDAFALSIAKLQNLILLTSDGPLRKAAAKEGVEVHGTIWLIDELWDKDKLNNYEYLSILEDLNKHNGKGVRLPKNELARRLTAFLR